MIFPNVQLKDLKNFGDVNAYCGKHVFLIYPNPSGGPNSLDALWFLRDVA